MKTSKPVETGSLEQRENNRMPLRERKLVQEALPRDMKGEFKRKDTATLAVAVAKGQRLSPAQVGALRSMIANYMDEALPLAAAVIHGRVKWSPTQARVFSALLNKVVPDLSASFHQHEHSVKALREMSREELEAIVHGTEAIAAQDDEFKPHEYRGRVIDHESDPE